MHMLRWSISEKPKQSSQNRRDLPRDNPLVSVEVLRYDIKRSTSENKGIVPTEMELVLEQTQQVLIKEKLKAARDRHKRYDGNRRKPLEFEVEDQMLLKVSPKKRVIRFGKKGKLAPRYVGPFEIPVAYRLRLPEELSSVHDTFRVSDFKEVFGGCKSAYVTRRD
ncbi:hypothetical protein Tco_1466468 [Tanacetum coccineum]